MLGLDFFLCVCLGFVFLCYLVYYFVLAKVILFSHCLLFLCLIQFLQLSQSIGWEECLRNDLSEMTYFVSIGT